MRNIRSATSSALGEAWSLAAPYWRSEERWRARGLLAAVVGLNLALVGMSVLLSYWNREFFNALEARDAALFSRLLFAWAETESGPMPGFVWIAALFIVVAVYALYLRQALQIRWRAWLTERLLADWLDGRAYYRLSLESQGADNPDQRLAEDAKLYVDNTLALGLGLMRSVVTLFSFLAVLWALSGPTTVLGVTVPGYMVWIAILYAILGTWLTHLIGRRLVPLNFRQQRVEADFRYALVRFRDSAEGVALHRGEAEEGALLKARFRALMENWWGLMVATKRLTFFTASYTQVAIVFPFVVAAPAFFAGRIPLGGLTQTANAFGEVQGALSWIVDNYAGLTEWRATVTRLVGFRDAVAAARAAPPGPVAEADGGASLRLDGLSLALPDGRVLVEGARGEVGPGESVVIAGPSGSGKSTLFRAVAGIWPFGNGRVALPAGARALFLTQRPYIPLGTLRRAVCYPAAPSGFADAEVRAALEEAGLAHLLPQLDDGDEGWPQRLSGGEQQRLALARALLLKPDWIFLDEATASLDPEAERALYETLRRRLPNAALVSIAHRPAVAEFHDRRWELRKGRLATTPP